MTAAATPPAHRKLVIVGGAEDKLQRRTVLRRFVEEAGGREARVLVCATASALGRESTELYDAVFRKLGVAEVIAAQPQTRAQADVPHLSRSVAQATAVWFTGGNQLKLAMALRGTMFGDAVVSAYNAGTVVGGTSAGASVVSEHMIAAGTTGESPKQRMAALTQGLGLLAHVIVDQHFGERNRYGRLLSLVAGSPHLLGIGIDEDTAAVISDERVLEVVGKGSVFVADGRGARSNIHSAKGTEALLVSGVVVHHLPAGARFDVHDRLLLDFDDPYPDETPASLEEASAEIRALARAISAEGVDDAVVARNRRRRLRRAMLSPVRNEPVD